MPINADPPHAPGHPRRVRAKEAYAQHAATLSRPWTPAHRAAAIFRTLRTAAAEALDALASWVGLTEDAAALYWTALEWAEAVCDGLGADLSEYDSRSRQLETDVGRILLKIRKTLEDFIPQPPAAGQLSVFPRQNAKADARALVDRECREAVAALNKVDDELVPCSGPPLDAGTVARAVDTFRTGRDYLANAETEDAGQLSIFPAVPSAVGDAFPSRGHAREAIAEALPMIVGAARLRGMVDCVNAIIDGTTSAPGNWIGRTPEEAEAARDSRRVRDRIAREALGDIAAWARANMKQPSAATKLSVGNPGKNGHRDGLEKHERAILIALSRAPHPLLLADLAERRGCPSRRTCEDVVKVLIKKGYATRRNKERAGVAITDAGREALSPPSRRAKKIAS